jgi:putative transposase
MGHTYTNLLLHLVFSTKERAPLIDAEMKPRLLAYLGGIVHEMDALPMAINGAADHVHLLIDAPKTMSLSDFMRTLKTNSSKWVHDEWPGRSAFAWQTGYGAFSVSFSKKDEVAAYIQRQEEHHKTFSFQEEYLAFLKRHAIQFDERYVWD